MRIRGGFVAGALLLIALVASDASAAGAGVRAGVPVLQVLLPRPRAVDFERYDLRLRVFPDGKAKVLSRFIFQAPGIRSLRVPVRLFLPGAQKVALSFDGERVDAAARGGVFELSLTGRKVHVLKVIAVLDVGAPESAFLEIRRPVETAFEEGEDGVSTLPDAADPEPWSDLLPREARYRVILPAGYAVVPGGNGWRTKEAKGLTSYSLRVLRACPVAAVTGR